MFVFVIWLASTLNFFVPRLTPRNPIEEKLLSLTEFGGSSVDIQSLVKAYNAKFGLDRPLAPQYLAYLNDIAAFRPRLLDRRLSDARRRDPAARAALDHRPAADHHAARLRARHAAGRAHRLAAGAARVSRARAAADDLLRDPVLPDRPDADLRLRGGAAMAAARRRHGHPHHAEPQPLLRAGNPHPLHPARRARSCSPRSASGRCRCAA